MAQASILIGLPRQQDSHTESSMTFEGEPTKTEDEAKEKAAQVTLECICADYNIPISEHNYYALQVTKERAHKTNNDFCKNMQQLLRCVATTHVSSMST